MSKFDKNDKFNKPYIREAENSYFFKHYNEILNKATELKLEEMISYSLENQISLYMVYDKDDYNNLIHQIIITPTGSESIKLDMIKVLVEKEGINPDKPNKYNKTPLHYACEYQLEKIIEYLLKLGVNVNYQDNSGFTPFHYLLMGNIKPIKKSSDVLDFISIQYVRSYDYKSDILSIKKLLNEHIQKIEFPYIITALERTLSNELIYNNEDEQLITNFSKTINLQDPVDVTNFIKMVKQLLINKYLNRIKFNKNSITIHDYNETSWTPLNKLDKGLIENANIKKIIKKDNDKIKDEICEFNKIRIINDEFFSNNRANGYSDFIANEYFLNRFIPIDMGVPTPTGLIQVSVFIYQPDYNHGSLDNNNNRIRHHNALDNASSIINHDNLTYMGGPRHIQIYFRETPINEVKTLLQYIRIEQQILYLLAGFVDNNTINNIDKNNIYNEILNDPVLQNANIAGSLAANNVKVYTPPAGVPVTTAYNTDYANQLRIFTQLAYHLIYYGKESDETKNIDWRPYVMRRNRRPPPAMILSDEDNYFKDKWLNKINMNINSWLYEFWNDLNCRYSPDNLHGNIDFRLLMLIASLVDSQTLNINQVINSYKPHLITSIFHATDSNGIKLTKWILLLLNDNVNYDFIIELEKNQFNIDFIDIDRLLINNNLKLLARIIYKFIQNGNITTLVDDEKTYYDKYELKNRKPLQVISRIITEQYNELKYKPLKTTFLDTIYFINKIDMNNIGASIDEFKKISALELFKTPSNPMAVAPNTNLNVIINNIPYDLSENLQPSFYSYLNHETASNNSERLKSSEHLIISHILGYYYLGIVDKISFNLNNLPITGRVRNSNQTRPLSFSSILDNPAARIPYIRLTHHALCPRTPNFVNGTSQNPLPLGAIYIPNTHDEALTDLNIIVDPRSYRQFLMYGEKNYLYIHRTNDIYIPTIHAYYMTLLNKISYYQKKIKPLLDVACQIMTNIYTNNKRLNELYTKIYPTLLIYSHILSLYSHIINNSNLNPNMKEIINRVPYMHNFNQSMVDMTNNLNKLNSNIYLYYYLFTPEQLMKLSRFNFYQLPNPNNTNSVNYLYYDNQPEELELDKDISQYVGIETKVDDDIKELKTGLVNNFSIGIYNNFEEAFYKNNVFNTIYTIKNTDFERLKTSYLPPSLYNSIETFYEYALIELIKKYSSSNIDEIITNVKNILEKNNIIYNELYIHKIICECIAELIEDTTKGRLEEVINTFLRNTITRISNLPNLPVSIDSLLINNNYYSVNLNDTNIKIDPPNNVIAPNVYNLALNSIKSNDFIIYNSDFNNSNIINEYKGISINTNIIKKLLKAGGSLYINNADNQSPIFPIIKNYNYSVIKKLKEFIDFDIFKGIPNNYCVNDNKLHLDKILKTSDNTIKSYFKNIDSGLYNIVKDTIINNESFGRNILINLEESFNICSYITLQYLLELLVNNDYSLNPNYNMKNTIELFKLIEYNIDDINKNYLNENITKFKIDNKYTTFIIEERLREFENKKISLEQNIEKIREMLRNDDINKIDKVKNKLNDDIASIQAEINKIDRDIKDITDFKTTNPSNYLDNKSSTDDDIIKRYQNIDYDNILVTQCWNKLFDENINYNLGLINILKKQYQALENNNINDLEIIDNCMELIAFYCKYYFENNKYTETNKVVEFINNMLIYITKLIICNGIELVTKKVLLSYFIAQNNTLKNSIEYVDTIFSTMKEELYNNICPILVKNNTNIFNNKIDVTEYDRKPNTVILVKYFQILRVSPIKLNEELINMFEENISNYFDIIISKTLPLWLANCENIFRYFIVNDNSLKCILELASKKK